MSPMTAVAGRLTWVEIRPVPREPAPQFRVPQGRMLQAAAENTGAHPKIRVIPKIFWIDGFDRRTTMQ